jgi:predicted Zn-dependent peptidase
MIIENFGVDFTENEITNGVKLYSFYKPNSPIYIRIIFNAGSQFDGEKYGLAHFCEHIMVSGTEKYPSKTILSEKINEIGASRNAYTSNALMGITLNLAENSELPNSLEILGQILNKSIFTKDIIEKERGAILAEQTRKISNPSQYVWDLRNSLIYQGTKFEKPVLGFDETVKKISQEDLINYRDRYLINGEVAYFISGDFDKQMVINFLKSINGSRKPMVPATEKLTIAEEKKEAIKTIPNPEQNYIILSFRIQTMSDRKDRVVAEVVSEIFGQSNTSRLYKSLRDNRGLVYDVFSSIPNDSKLAFLSVNTNCKVKDSPETIKIIKEELNKIVENGVSKEELDLAKKNITRKMRFNSETARYWVDHGLIEELINFNDYILPDEYTKILKTVSVEEANLFAKKYLAGKEFMVAGVGEFKT